MSDLKFRADTQDRQVWESVHDNNEYGIPDDLTGKIVLDVGMHVGSFACLCKERGAAEVWGIESNIESLRLAIHNFHATPGDGILQPYYGAAWRSDYRGLRGSFVAGGYAPGYGHTTGCCVVTPFDGVHDEVPTHPFDDLLKSVTDWGRRRLDWLKLDCEGAEWPILWTSNGLQIVDNIVGEYHAGVIAGFGPEQSVEGKPYSIDGMKELLERSGFEVEITPPNMDWFGPFHAHRVRFGMPS